MRRALALALLLLVGSFALSGCAERLSKQQYERQIVKINKQRTQVVQQLPSSGTDDVQYFDKAQKEMTRSAEDLDAIQPPNDVQEAHDAYVKSLFGLARLMSQFADCARLEQRDREGSQACRREIQQRSIDDVHNDLVEAYTIYMQQGYEIPKPPDVS